MASTLAPCISMLSHSHPLTATSFPDVFSKSPVGSSFYSFSLSGCHSDVVLAHMVWRILATYPTHCPSRALHSLLCPFTPVLVINQSNFYSANIPGEARLSGDLIASFWIMSLFLMFNNDLSMLRWANASFLLTFC